MLAAYSQDQLITHKRENAMPMSVRKADRIANDKNREITSSITRGNKGMGKSQDVTGGNTLQSSARRLKWHQSPITNP